MGQRCSVLGTRPAACGIDVARSAFGQWSFDIIGDARSEGGGEPQGEWAQEGQAVEDESLLCLGCGLAHAFGEAPREDSPTRDPIMSALNINNHNDKSSVGNGCQLDAGRSFVSERCLRVDPIESSTHLASEMWPVPKKTPKEAWMIHGKREAMESEGWTELKSGRGRREFAGATDMVMPPVDGATRGITRDSDTNALMEDLWFRGRTPEGLIKRSLKRPRNLEVQVELEVQKTRWRGVRHRWLLQKLLCSER